MNICSNDKNLFACQLSSIQDGWGYPFQKIFSLSNGSCYPFQKIFIHLDWKRFSVHKTKKIQLFPYSLDAAVCLKNII